MKFIRPIVTDRPMLMMNSSAPYATPSNNTPAMLVTATPSSLRLFARVLDVVELVELDVPQLVVLLLNPAHVDRLHDIARFGIDHDRTARARRLVRLENFHRLVAVDLAVQLFH